VCLVLAAYRLLDLSQALAAILVFEPQRRRDEQGSYILVRHSVRWVLITLLNLAEVVLYFSFFYLSEGCSFEPPISTRIGALYQSCAIFITGGGAVPETDIARAIVILHLACLVFFLVVAVPIILSVMRAKERTGETLGDGAEPDKRV